MIRNIVVLCNGESVIPSMLPAPLDSDLSNMKVKAPVHTESNQNTAAAPHEQNMNMPMDHSSSQVISELIRPMSEVEKEAIERAIDLCGGNIPTAAHYLGISAATIYRKKNQWKETSL